MAWDVDSLITRYALKDETFSVPFLAESFTFRYPQGFVELMELGKRAAKFAKMLDENPLPEYKGLAPEGESEWAKVLVATAFEMQELSLEPKLTAADVFKLADAFPFEFTDAVGEFNRAIAQAKNRAENARIDDLKNDSTATA